MPHAKGHKQYTKKDMMTPSILDKMSQSEIMENLIRLKLIDPSKDFKKGGDVKKTKPKDTIGVMIAVGKVKNTGKNKMAYGGTAQGKQHSYAAGGIVKDNLKPVPSGSQGKGLSKLPMSVRNNMGYLKKGGMIKN